MSSRAFIVVRIAAACLAVACAAGCASVPPASRPAEFAVGLRQVEYVDTAAGPRTLTMNVFYPAKLAAPPPQPSPLPFYANVRLYRDAPIAAMPSKSPLIVFSHGRGSSGLVYAWFSAYLASRGYVVAAIDHYKANANDRSIVYLANKLWQRPVDVSLDITYLTTHEPWSAVIDASRIGIAGHSQGGFTALWIGGAKVDAERFLAFQRRWKNDPAVPKHLRDEMPVDAAPAQNVADPRVNAVFAMAPGLVQAFGMDATGLAQMRVPAYIVVGASDTVAPPPENALFAATYIPNNDLLLLQGAVGHEIFVNECDDDGRKEIPESCIDAPGIDRAKLHQDIAAAALRFFDANLAAAAR